MPDGFWGIVQSNFSDPYLNRFLQPDSIIPNQYNPQNLNRFSFVGNNPINFSDPTGHWRIECGANGEECGGSGVSLVSPPNNGGEPGDSGGHRGSGSGHSPGAQGCGNLGQMRCNGTRSTSDSTTAGSPNNGNFYEAISGWGIDILKYQYTPLAMASLQFLTGEAFDIVLPMALVPGAGEIALGGAITLFGINRGAAVIGTASTFYQYSKHYYGTNGFDVTESVVTTLVGTFPPASVNASLVNLFWSGFRTDWSHFPQGIDNP